MKSVTFTNNAGHALVFIVEPVADEYRFLPGDKIEVGPPLNVDYRQVVDIHIGTDTVVIYAPEQAAITRNGKPVTPEVIL